MDLFYIETTIGSKLKLCPQPPIQVYGVEGRYATALFSAASKQKNLDKVEQELGRVSVSGSFSPHHTPHPLHLQTLYIIFLLYGTFAEDLNSPNSSP